MSDHEHDHDHDDHAPIADGDEPPAAARVRALEALLVEKGVDRPRGRARGDRLARVAHARRRRAARRARVGRPGLQASACSPTARAAALELGIDPGPAPVLVAVENTERVHHMVVCTLCSCYPRGLLGPPPDWYKSLPYRSRAVSDPRGVLAEFGSTLDDDVELRVLDSTADIRYLVIPRRPAGTRGPDRGRARRARHARRDDRRHPPGGARRGRLLARDRGQTGCAGRSPPRGARPSSRSRPASWPA